MEPSDRTSDEPDRLFKGSVLSLSTVEHREDEYDSRGFALLSEMQRRHFWYRGRHRFLLDAVHRHLKPSMATDPRWVRAVDLGGGCGGWLHYLMERCRIPLAEVALADSSEAALQLSFESLPPDVQRYRINLLSLGWAERWEVGFLLDVLEHIPDHREALRQIRNSLTPGGYLFLTVPALQSFWSWNDEAVHHQRRYSRADFASLAADCGLRLLDARYFMFFLSPLLLASRLVRRPDLGSMSSEQVWELVERTHRIPHPLVNALLGAIFRCESPLGHDIPFPWGTSLLAVLQKPID